MVLTPLAYPLDVLGIAEVIPVLGLLQPALLADPFALPLARRLGTEFLAFAIAAVGSENIPAVQAFGRFGRGLHRSTKTAASAMPVRSAGGKKTPSKRRPWN